MNEAQVIVTGNVANKPSLGTTPGGVSVANMRLGYTPRRLDRESGQWVDGQTSWVTVKCWRKLADHVAMSLHKGDPIVVKGALQVRPFTDKDGNPRLGVEVLASAVGHDLSRGVTNFMRTSRRTGAVTGGTQGDPEAGVSGQPAGEPAEANGHSAGMRSVPAVPWDPARDDAADDTDADIFDETAVVAAALHAVPDLDAENDANDGVTAPRSGGTLRSSDLSGTASGGQPAGGQSGEGQSGEGQAGEGQAGEGQAGEGQQGHDKEGDGQQREGEHGTSKDGDSQQGEGQQDDGKERGDQDTDGQPGDGQPGDGGDARSAGDARGDAAGNEPGEEAAASRRQARVPVQRKPGTRTHRRAGVPEGTTPAKEPSLT